MRVLGVDASTINIGWAIMDCDREALIKFGALHYDPKKPFYHRLREAPRALFAEVDIRAYNIRTVVIEHAFFHKNAFTGKQISMMVGAILFAAMNHGVETVKELSPTEIKKAFAHFGKAEKSQIRQHILFEFGIDVENEDAADAIATAQAYLTYFKSGEFERRADIKRERAMVARRNSAKKEAAKRGKTVKGELPLCFMPTPPSGRK